MRFVGRSQSGNQLEEQRTMVTSVNSASRNLDNQLKTRRKVAKMLIAVVIMFSINFFPVHFLPVLNVRLLYFFFQNMFFFSCLGTIHILRQQKTGWAGSVNGRFLLTFCTVFADVGGWVRKGPKMCWRNIWMVPKEEMITMQKLAGWYLKEVTSVSYLLS